MSWRLKRTKHLIVLAVSLAVAFVTTARADILHVPGDFLTIQEAIDAAVDGDEVEVHPGTYNETINLLGKAITVRSSDGAGMTTIDGTGLGDSVVKCLSGEEPDTILDGFTITGGSAEFGGGMYNINSSPTVTNCTFSGNSANFGGGMHNTSTSSPTVTNCTFSANTAFSGGGMLSNTGSSPTVTNCTFSGNTAEVSGGGMYNFNTASSPTVTNCFFEANTASYRGGAIYNNTSSPLITNSLFVGNSASPPKFGGGAIFNIGPECNPVITNCTFASNTGPLGGAMLNLNFSFPVVTNCILWGNTLGQIFDDLSLTTVFYSDIEGGWIGLGSNNIDGDPLFVDPGAGDYRLSSGSPCIDAADNTAVPKGIDTDLDGNPRFVDDPDTKDTGNGDPPIVDMGAYEFQPVLCPWDLDGTGDVGVKDLLDLLGTWGPCPKKGDCPADFDVSGDVGVKDLLTLLGNWGPCPK